jgi:hypothetical protein
MVKSISVTLSAKFDLQHTIPFEFTLAATPSATDDALSIAEQRQVLGAEQEAAVTRIEMADLHLVKEQ